MAAPLCKQTILRAVVTSSSKVCHGNYPTMTYRVCHFMRNVIKHEFYATVPLAQGKEPDNILAVGIHPLTPSLMQAARAGKDQGTHLSYFKGHCPIRRNYSTGSVVNSCDLLCNRSQYLLSNDLSCRPARLYTHWSAVKVNPCGRVHQPETREVCTRAEDKLHCWKCKTEIEYSTERFFCHCGVIQPPDANHTYFEILGQEQKFDIQTEKLAQMFKSLQWRLHPDKFSQKSKEEQTYSELQSALVNEAYVTLAKPLARGLYMLKLAGHCLEENEIQMDPEFLMEIMELNEDLADADSDDAVVSIGQENREVLAKLTAEISQAFQAEDYLQAKELLARLKYYANIDEKVKEKSQTYISH